MSHGLSEHGTWRRTTIANARMAGTAPRLDLWRFRRMFLPKVIELPPLLRGSWPRLRQPHEHTFRICAPCISALSEMVCFSRHILQHPTVPDRRIDSIEPTRSLSHRERQPSCALSPMASCRTALFHEHLVYGTVGITDEIQPLERACMSAALQVIIFHGVLPLRLPSACLPLR